MRRLILAGFVLAGAVNAAAQPSTVTITIPTAESVDGLTQKVNVIGQDTADIKLVLEDIKKAIQALDVRIAALEAGKPQPLTFTAAPSTIPVSGTVNVSFAGISTPSATDWVGAFRPGAVDDPKAMLDWFYTSSCSQTATVARPAGSCAHMIAASLTGIFEFRLFRNDAFTSRLSVAGPISVQAAPEPVKVIASESVATCVGSAVEGIGLTWEPAAPAPDGYQLLLGPSIGTYDPPIDAGAVPPFYTPIPAGTTLCGIVQAYNWK